MIAYLDSLSLVEAIQLALYMVAFGMFIRFGFRYVDWILEDYEWFFSRSKKDR